MLYYIILIIFSFGAFTCGDSFVSPRATQLSLHSANGNKPTSSDAPGTIQVVITSGDQVFCYGGKALETGAYFSISNKKKFRTFLNEMKQKWGKQLKVQIKPSKESSYGATVVVLDEMTINNIRDFSIVDPTPAEIQRLHIHATGDNDTGIGGGDLIIKKWN